MRKKLLSLISMILIIFALVGCSNKDTTDKKEPSNTPTNENTDNSSADSNNSNENESTLPIKNEEDKKTSESKEKSCRIFYYDINKSKQFYVDTNVEVIDGALVSALTNEMKNTNYGDDLIVLSRETNVTSATLDKDNAILKVYFNDSFKKSTNLGTAAEVGLIDSLVNTYGYNFNVKKVAIYVNGKPYTDQRGEMPGGYFTVDTSKATKL